MQVEKRRKAVSVLTDYVMRVAILYDEHKANVGNIKVCQVAHFLRALGAFSPDTPSAYLLSFAATIIVD